MARSPRVGRACAIRRADVGGAGRRGGPAGGERRDGEETPILVGGLIAGCCALLVVAAPGFALVALFGVRLLGLPWPATDRPPITRSAIPRRGRIRSGPAR